ncbi:MAG TPA: ethanolamine ammonia-lyase subunit EutC [Pirellulales bacterium]|jgi:ethanolamine ammonia-lyase small subunit|nr:ethanolamine ammonia-lyase subunit EutC [Pirellulales bacterium]
MSDLPKSAERAATDALLALRERTPARLLVGRSGPAYRTATQLDLREDHALAVDAVQTEMDLTRDLGQALIDRSGLFEVSTLAIDKSQFLRRPELGRQLSAAARAEIAEKCPVKIDLQVAIGDGLSAAAIAAQVPALLPLLESGAEKRGWTFGRPFAIRYCRVGVLNDIGDVLDPQVVVLLIGERPGLATAESLSAYMAFRPRPGHTDAQRNLISNIHARGVDPATAAERILALAEQMRVLQSSGVAIKEHLPALASGLPRAQLPNKTVMHD